MSNRTPIERDQKLDAIEHIHQDHTEELHIIVGGIYQNQSVHSVVIADIFKEGVLLNICLTEGSEPVEKFVKFDIKGDVGEQIFYLAYTALVKQGRDFAGNRKQFFEIIDKQTITPNISRLVIQSSSPLPEYYAGHAYSLLLKTMEQKPLVNQEEKPKTWLQTRMNLLALWAIKKLSVKRRHKILGSRYKNVRTYTLRSAWQSSDKMEYPNQGSMDIFTHGESAGSQWVENLKIGDVIFSRAGGSDKHTNLHHGRAVLIGDETAYPAMAGILENWQNPQPPHVVVLSAQKSEQKYFKAVDLPKGSKLYQLVCSPAEQADHILKTLSEISSFDTIWGAFEGGAAKDVRHHIRNHYEIEGNNNRIKAYWRLDKVTD